MRPWTDSEGTPITPGCIVAFNYSGNVARGLVDYVPERATGGAVKILHITREGAVRGPTRWSTGVSRVKNGASILVLQEAS